MDLQSLFYIIAIIYMILGIIILLVIAYSLWTIQRRIQEVKHNVIDRVASFIQDKRIELMGSVGMGLAAFVFNRIRKIFKRD